MKLNQNNIGGFITYLFKNRRNEQPPAELIARWQSLSDTEIDTQLSGLFQSWGLTEADKQREVERYLQHSLYVPAPEVKRPVAPPPPPVQRPVSIIPERKKKSSRWPLLAFVLLLLVVGGYFGVKFVQFKSLSYIFTITDNVAVRNEKKEMVATMDLFEVKKNVPSYQKLRAFDSKIYYRSIDESDKKFPCRKVMLEQAGFWDYFTGNEKMVGYVNTNYVVDNQNEFDLYQNAFKEVKNNRVENANLKAIYRKIIIGSMGMDPAFSDKYIVTNTEGLSRTVVDKTYAVLKQTLIDNVKYVIIAGLSDGNYYRFAGDIKENSFEAPELIDVVNGATDPVALSGSYRFFNSGKTIYLYDCKANMPLNFEAEKDAQGRIASFVYKAPADTTTVTTDTVQNL